MLCNSTRMYRASGDGSGGGSDGSGNDGGSDGSSNNGGSAGNGSGDGSSMDGGGDEDADVNVSPLLDESFRRCSGWHDPVTKQHCKIAGSGNYCSF